MKKKIIFTLVIFMVGIGNITALSYAGCEYSLISRLKSFVNNVNTSYDYHIINGEAYFDITLSNIPNGVYIEDANTGLKYYNFINNELVIRNYNNQSAKYIFHPNNSNCNSVSLGSKYVTLPIYNIYYGSESCKDIPNFSLCKKWINKVYGTNEFETLVSEYKESLEKDDDIEQNIEYQKTLLDKIVEFYVKYYYILLIGIIVICGLIILINRNREKNKFKL